MAYGQIEVSVTIESGSSTTTCTDVFGAPDPLWSVNINGEGEFFYPETGNCFTSLPNLQYTSNYTCPTDIPATIQVCFSSFENDDLLAIFCAVTKSCNETICFDTPVPAVNTNLQQTLSLPANLSSGGEVTYTVSTTSAIPFTANDTICGAIDLGILNFSDTLGNASLGLYQNFCATNTNDPQPSFFNDAGVWFSFLTGANPSGEIFVDVLSDPEALGFGLDTQVAIYTSETGDCTGNLVLEVAYWDPNSLDTRIPIICPMPNTTYYIMVDGIGPVDIEGVFGIEVIDIGIVEGGDFRCDYEDLGEVPEGGFVETPNWTSNFCSTDTDDPYVQAFVSQHSVWFGFIAPPSGHVLIEGITDTLIDSIGLQLALYRSFNQFCNGPFGHVMSQYDIDELNQSMIATCLYPGRPYWILVDGTGFNSKGVFKIRVTDNGDITPKTTIDTTICAGTSFNVGTSSYTMSGSYADTLNLFAGCDSIVFTNLSVLNPIQATINQTPAIGMTATASAMADATGGAGNYTYAWCNGETGNPATALVGGDNCCVTITDDIGCELIECFDVAFLVGIVPIFENDSLDCYGQTSGIIRFTTYNGEPPYNFSWSQVSTGLAGSGTIIAEGDETEIIDLPGGDVEITITDNVFDTTFTALVFEPTEILVIQESVLDASCYGFCDGEIEVTVSGGTGTLTYLWSNGESTNDLSGLCKGDYELTVTDENNCELVVFFSIGEPLEFIATPNTIQNVSCFEGSDGQAGVLLQNGTAAEYSWINNESTPEISGLSAGFYDVTITNTDGCEAYTSVEITEPSAPLLVEIDVLNEVSCFGVSDAILGADVSGPGNTLVYNWSSGSQTSTAINLGAGTYDLTVINENSCIAEASINLSQPTQLVASLSAKDITCLDPPNGGEINIDTVYGGIPGYTFSVDGLNFSSGQNITGLEEGYYEVIVKDNSECETLLDITVNGPPELSVTLGDDYEISLGELTTIQALTNSSNLDYTWNHTDTINTDEIEVSPFVSTLYSVMVFDTITKCSAQDAVFIWVNKDRNIYIPNAFSPNDDGINDRFHIFGGVGIGTIKSFRVFSRGGDLVHERTNFQPNDPMDGWDGKFHGQFMNTGVFVFMAEIEFVDGATEIFKGEVMLMR
jgi:gliding motility-associated-like protein